MNEQNKQINHDDDDLLLGLDKFFIFMAIGYLVKWFVSIQFFRQYWDDYSHDGFFDNTGVVLLSYLGLTIVSFLAKDVFYSRFMRTATYGLFGFFISFPLLGEVGAMIVAGVLAFFASSKHLATSFVTGTLVGYWFTLFIVGFINLLMTDGGSDSLIWTFLGTFVNAADWNVHKITLTWLIFIPLAIGYFFYRTFESVEKLQVEEKTLKQEHPKQAMRTVTESKPQPVVEKEKEEIPLAEPTSEQPSEAPKKRRYTKEKDEKPSKTFFNPNKNEEVGTKHRFKQSWENLMRKLSK